MADILSFPAEPREGAGKGPARALRRQGRVPAVIYGEKKEQQLISIGTRQLKRALHDPHFHSTLCALELQGEQIRALPRETQVHPVTDEPLHADFVRVSKGSIVTVDIPVSFINEEAAPGLRRGGVLNIVRRELELACPADAIPSEITIDLAGFDINDSIHLSHAQLPEGARPTITDRDFTIATISAPTVTPEEEEEAAVAEAAEAAEAEAPEGEVPAEAEVAEPTGETPEEGR